MIVAIHQPQYMPWIGYFHKMASSDIFVLLDDVQFKKNEWQHRNRIRNARDWQWLSVPTAYRHPQLINQVRVQQNGTWQDKHLKSIRSCYGKAAFYDEYIGAFEAYYRRSWDTIDTVSTDSILLLADLLGLRTRTVIASQFRFSGASTERLTAICTHFGADTYLSGIGGKGYLDESLFRKAGIAVRYQQFTCPSYRQHWSRSIEDFIPNLSAVDLLFNCGPESHAILMGERRHAYTSL